MRGVKHSIRELAGVSEARTTVSEERYSRFRALVPPERLARTTVAVIGCGGIGSWVALGLGCLGVRLKLYDPDTTELVNYGAQPLPKVGVAKVEQLRDHVGSMTHVDAFQVKVEEHSDLQADIWVSGLDSIPARIGVWEALKQAREKHGTPEWYVDGRMGGVTSNVLVVDMRSQEGPRRYEESLRPSGGFEKEPCALRTTVFAGMGTGAQIVAAVALALRGEGESRQVNMDWLYGSLVEGWTR